MSRRTHFARPIVLVIGACQPAPVHHDHVRREPRVAEAPVQEPVKPTSFEDIPPPPDLPAVPEVEVPDPGPRGTQCCTNPPMPSFGQPVTPMAIDPDGTGSMVTIPRGKSSVRERTILGNTGDDDVPCLVVQRTDDLTRCRIPFASDRLGEKPVFLWHQTGDIFYRGSRNLRPLDTRILQTTVGPDATTIVIGAGTERGVDRESRVSILVDGRRIATATLVRVDKTTSVAKVKLTRDQLANAVVRIEPP